MNNLGQVCGYGDTTVATSSGLALADHAWLYAGSGALVDLGTLGPATGVSIATAINDTGTVVGYADSSGTLTPGVCLHAERRNAEPADFSGGDHVRERRQQPGQIAGYATAADGTYTIASFIRKAGRWSSSIRRTRHCLSTTPEKWPLSLGREPDLGTFISNGGTGAWINIGSLGGTQTYPDAINSRGDIVGYALDASGTDQTRVPL